MRKSRIWLAVFLCGFVLSFACLQGLADALTEDTCYYLDEVDTVYVTHGYCYHSISDCRNTNDSYAVDASEALRLGYKACSNCDPLIWHLIPMKMEFDEEDIVVYMQVEDLHYHTDDMCSKFDAPKDGRIHPRVPITLEEAEHLELQPCKSCKPPKS